PATAALSAAWIEPKSPPAVATVYVVACAADAQNRTRNGTARRMPSASHPGSGLSTRKREFERRGQGVAKRGRRPAEDAPCAGGVGPRAGFEEEELPVGNERRLPGEACDAFARGGERVRDDARHDARHLR